jgi:hypothetical protein
MPRRTRDVPPLRSIPKTVEARHYNRVRLALIRLANPLRIRLSGLHQAADIILSDREWLCVDRSRDDLPLMAWTDFDVHTRAALHEPVRCTLHLYHSHAGLLMGRVLATLDGILAERMAVPGRPSSSQGDW